VSHNLKSYPEYKDTGVLCFGEVPAHWRVDRLGVIFKERGEVNWDERVTQVLSVLRDRGVILYEQKGNIGNKRSEDITRYKIVRPDDIVVNCMNVIIGSVGLSRYTGCLSPVYYVLQARNDDDSPHYFNHVFGMKPFQRSLVRLGNGILSHRMRIPMEKLKCELLPRPPIEEQRAIARFLDHYDRLTRRYIRMQRRLIDLLTEQKQTLIQQAVTRGLDPDVPLKDSGVEWLGDVPEHWNVWTLSRLIQNIEQGWSPVAAEGAITADQWTVLTLSAVKKGEFDPDAIKPISQSADIPDGIEVYPEDFLLTRSNTRSLVGDVCVVDRLRPRTVLCDLIYRLSIDNSKLLSRFLMYWMLSPFGRFQIEADARGSSQTMVKLSQGHIKGWRILLPPLREQALIVDYLDQISRKWKRSTTELEKQIDLIREYRTRLIADVVTGKLDVRSVPLPDLDETGEPDDVDDLKEDLLDPEEGSDE